MKTGNEKTVTEKDNRIETAVYLKCQDTESVQPLPKEMKVFLDSHEELHYKAAYMEAESGEEMPAFMLLLEAVRCGEISCIVTENLASFGRSPLEAGYYIGTVFPLLNVRFIAVEDNFDSGRQADLDSLSIRMEALVTELTAKEFSRKQEVFREMCRETGRVMKTNNAYGYKFSEETGRLAIDSETEDYVRMIFAWALMGVKRPEIARRLELLGAPTPGQCANQHKETGWSGNMLQTILYNPVYAGFHVMGKSKASFARGIRQHDVDREKWLYFPDYHEPYITMEEYEKIREMMNKNKVAFEKAQKDAVEKRKELPDYFPEKVICAYCNRKMVFIRGTHQRGNEAQFFGYYRCRSRKKDGSCRNSHVQGELLQIRVMDEIGKLTGENGKREFSPELADKLVERIWVHENGARIEVAFYNCTDEQQEGKNI